MKYILKTFSFLISFFLFLSSGFSSVIKGGEEVVISDPVTGNLYAAGGKVTINAIINGDLVTAGGELTLNDSIRQDVLLAGGNIRINGPIGEDLRVAGGNIRLQSSVGGDLLVAGGNVEVDREVIIYGDILAGSGNLVINGTVRGMMVTGVGNLEFNGAAEHDFTAKGGSLKLNGEIRGTSELAAEEIILGENCRFYKDVRYWHKNGELDFSGKLADGASAVFDPSLQSEIGQFNWNKIGTGAAGFWIWRLISSSLLIALLIALFSRFFARSVDHYYQQYLNKFGWGMAYLFLIPVAVVILMVTIIGIPVALILMSVYAASVIFSHSLVAVLASFELQQRKSGTWSKGLQILVAIGMFVIIKLISAIPFLGWLFSLTVIAIALGTLLMYVFKPEKYEEFG